MEGSQENEVGCRYQDHIGVQQKHSNSNTEKKCGSYFSKIILACRLLSRLTLLQTSYIRSLDLQAVEKLTRISQLFHRAFSFLSANSCSEYSNLINLLGDHHHSEQANVSSRWNEAPPVCSTMTSISSPFSISSLSGVSSSLRRSPSKMKRH